MRKCTGLRLGKRITLRNLRWEELKLDGEGKILLVIRNMLRTYLFGARSEMREDLQRILIVVSFCVCGLGSEVF